MVPAAGLDLLLGQNYVRCLCVDETNREKSEIRAMQVFVEEPNLIDRFKQVEAVALAQAAPGEQEHADTQVEGEGGDDDCTGCRDKEDAIRAKPQLNACTKNGEVLFLTCSPSLSPSLTPLRKNQSSVTLVHPSSAWPL